jgi:hypothetical protein
MKNILVTFSFGAIQKKIFFIKFFSIFSSVKNVTCAKAPKPKVNALSWSKLVQKQSFIVILKMPFDSTASI